MEEHNRLLSMTRQFFIRVLPAHCPPQTATVSHTLLIRLHVRTLWIVWEFLGVKVVDQSIYLGLIWPGAVRPSPVIAAPALPTAEHGHFSSCACPPGWGMSLLSNWPESGKCPFIVFNLHFSYYPWIWASHQMLVSWGFFSFLWIASSQPWLILTCGTSVFWYLEIPWERYRQ